MKRALVLVAALAVLVAFGYLTWLNPHHVEIHHSAQNSVQAPLGLLLIFTLLGGALAALVVVWTLRFPQVLSRWRQRRRARTESRVASWETTGIALAWEGHLDRARSLLLKAWRRRPDKRAALALASSYTDTEEYVQARQILEEAVGHDKTDPELRFRLGEVLQRSGDLNDAIHALEAVRAQHPRSPRALRGLRDLYERLGRWHEAAQVQETYLGTVPAPSQAAAERERLLHFRYQAAEVLKDARGRAEAFGRLVEDHPTFVPAIVGLGDALVASGRPEEARKLLERALRRAPQTVVVERLLALQATPPERQRVLVLLKKARQALDGDRLHLLGARTAIENGDLETAAVELGAVTGPELPELNRLWAEIYRRRGQFEQAFKALSRATDRAAVSPSSYRCRACGHVAEAWTGHCPSCHRWDTYRSALEIAAAS